jgi:hypothetical protein
MGNKAILAVLLAGALVGPTIAAAASPTGYWPFDGNLNDAVGTANATFAGGTPTYQKGQIGQAISFDGVAQYVNIPSPVNPAMYTIALWVKPARLADAAVVTRTDASGPTTSWSHQLRIQGNVFHHYLWVGAERHVAGTTTIVPDTWYHVAIVAQNNGPMRLYVNGKEDGPSISTAGTLWATGTRITVGSNSGHAMGWFQGLVDDLRIYSEILSPADIEGLMRVLPRAGLVSPADGATDIPRDATLNWDQGPYPATHDVYLGTAFADVNTASRTAAKGVLASQGQADTTFDPPGSLAYGQTYYWRIDEVNKSPDNTIFKGDVWSFTAEPYGYPIVKVTATASNYQPGMGPEKTVDGSGLKGDLHGTDGQTMWLSTGVGPSWIQYEFDNVYKLHQMLVWNSNQLIEPILGFGARKVTIETSADGTTWTPLADVPEFAKASGLSDYAANTTVSFGGVEAKFVKLTIAANWGGIAPTTGLAEVRFLYVPVQARLPQPATAATGVSVGTDLNWRPGREAASHKVYFGTDPDAVTNGTVAAQTVTDHSFPPGDLDLGTTYYWRVDEVNAVTYPGDVWSFTTQQFAVVDDFESYTDKAGAEVFSTWVDGYVDKSSGSTVGLTTSKNGTYCETTILHSGKQSMPLAYDNTVAPFYSEATWTFDTPQDWTAGGIRSLSLWFQGAADNGGQLYVKINGTKVSYDGDAGDLARAGWRVWNLDLSQAGKLNSVRSLTIGIEGNGAQGTLYFDDIRLYPKTPEYFTPVQPAATGLVASYAFDEGSGTTVRDSSGNKNDGALRGSPQWTAGKTGGALRFGGTADYVEVPDSPSLQVADRITVAAWVLREVNQAGWERIMAKSDASLYDYWLQITSSGSIGGGFVDPAGVAHNNLDTTAGTALPVDQWVHVAFVYDGTYVRAYLNGQLDKSINIGSFKIRTGARPLWFGRLQNSYVLQGRIDEGCVYNRALRQEEILWLAGQKTAVAKPF